MITDKKIREEASGNTTYMKGINYFLTKKVKNVQLDRDTNSFTAQVQGSSLYDVSVALDENDEICEWGCECIAFFTYDGACKHIVALLKYIQENWDALYNQNGSFFVNENAKYILEYFERENGKIQNFNASISPTYNFSVSNSGKKTRNLEFTIGNKDRMYVLRDIRKFLDAVRYQRPLNFGKSFTYEPDKTVFDNKSRDLLDLMMSVCDEQKYKSNQSYNYYGYENLRLIELNDNTLYRFFKAIGEDNFNISINNTKLKAVRVINDNPPFNLDLKKENKSINVNFKLGNNVFYGMDSELRYIYYRGVVYKTTEEYAKTIKPFLKCFAASKTTELAIPEREASRFFINVLPKLQKVSDVKIEEKLQESYITLPLKTKIYFDKAGEGISARVDFEYGAFLFDTSAPTDFSIVEGKTILRDKSAENEVINAVLRSGFEESNGLFTLYDENKLFDFLSGGINLLNDFGELFYSEAFKNLSVKKESKVSAGIRFNMDMDTLELTLQYEDLKSYELAELLNSYKLKKRYFRLKSGSFINIENDDNLQAAALLLEQLDITKTDQKTFSIPKYRAMYIDSLANEKKEIEINRCNNFKSFVDNVKKPKKNSFPLPEGITGELRDYQKTGYRWLKTLSHYGMGGILADDMGLGKTLQVIAFILSEKDKGLPNMVVAPTSLVYNWQDEVKKFAPQLKITVVSGTVAERTRQLEDIENADIVVTSYALIRRDIENYKDIKFNYCFIDEAQHIKNHNTLNSKTVKSINAKGYFALTGTPVENCLTELWSIFDFTMPGYLHSHQKFSSRFENPIVREGDKTALKELSRHTKPFIMRRLKKDVLKELPEKIESRIICDMTSEQSKLYDAYLLKIKNEFEEEISANGFEKSQIKILALLTRLRQLCCHPALFIENYKGGSGKLDTLTEILQDAKEGGHRVLIFSQFTSMLEIINQRIEKQNISSFYLCGNTKANERMDMVRNFNDGEKDVFLISLKAGGTGLNLNGADTVIHFDPWWNPAVEDQATDRAYRIGQKNVVQVFKLVTKNTIEEKIFELQQKKKELIDMVIKPGENFINKMNVDDIRRLFE